MLGAPLLPAVSRPPAAGLLGPPWNAEEVDTITQTVGGSLFPFFNVLGNLWTTVCGILLTLAIAKTLLGCLWRMKAVYDLRGFGPWILVGLWGTAFAILDIPRRILQAVAGEAVPPPEEELQALNGPGHQGQELGQEVDEIVIQP